MEKIMSNTDRRTKIMDAQQTSEVRELTAAELDSVDGGRGSILGAAAGAVVDAVFYTVVVPLMRTGLV
jgi:lactobin A/cerein 7B family class IIb bacteriocin